MFLNGLYVVAFKIVLAEQIAIVPALFPSQQLHSVATCALLLLDALPPTPAIYISLPALAAIKTVTQVTISCGLCRHLLQLQSHLSFPSRLLLSMCTGCNFSFSSELRILGCSL